MRIGKLLKSSKLQIFPRGSEQSIFHQSPYKLASQNWVDVISFELMDIVINKSHGETNKDHPR
jgi:hypothetical protein